MTRLGPVVRGARRRLQRQFGLGGAGKNDELVIVVAHSRDNWAANDLFNTPAISALRLSVARFYWRLV